MSDNGLHQLHSNVRDEASTEVDGVHTGPVTKETQIIAIYGKGGIGKSFTLANLSYMMAQQGKKVLLILRPQVGHHLAALRRQGVPHDHRNLEPHEARR